MSVGEFDGVFVPRGESIWGYHHVSFFQIFNRFWAAKEGINGFRLFLEFSQVGSGIRQMSCPSPAAQDCRGYVDLCPSYVAYGADQARWIVKASYRLVVFGAEAPHVAALAKVLWAGEVEQMANLVFQGLAGWGAHRCRAIDVVSSAGVPFRRFDYGFGRASPASIPPSMSFHIDHGMSDRCVAVCRDLDHHCAFSAEIYVCGIHLFAFCVEEESTRAHFPHLYSSRGVGQERTPRETRLSRV